MYQRLVTQDEMRVAEKAFRAVFRSANPFDEPFYDSIVSRAIIFPITGYFLTEGYFAAVVDAARRIGDTSLYISQVEGLDLRTSWENLNAHGQVVFPDFDYQRILSDFDPLVLETAFYSARGHWGLITSHLDHAVVGGPSGFLRYLGGHIDLDESLNNFLAYGAKISYRNGTVNETVHAWLPRLLIHMYGQDRAGPMMQESGIPFPSS